MLSLMKKVIHLYYIEKCQSDFCVIATAPATLEVNSNQFDSDRVLKLSPGEKHNLSIVAKDDLNNTVLAVITCSLSISTGTCSY